MSRIAVVGMSCRYPEADSVADLWRTPSRTPRVPPAAAGADAPGGLLGRRPGRPGPVLQPRTPPSSRGTSSTGSATGSPAAPTAPPTSPTGWRWTWPREALADAGFAGRRRAAPGPYRRGGRQHPHRRVLPRQRAAAALAVRAPGAGRRAAGAGVARPADRGVPRGDSRSGTRARSRRSTRRRSPVASPTPSPGGSATTSTSTAAATRWTPPAPPRLLAVVTAARALADGEVDVAVAGGVDLSLDPFEMVGFAKAGALARDEMRVYDERLAGLLAGRGLRHGRADARTTTRWRRGAPCYATIAGWGVSSDGQRRDHPARGAGLPAGAATARTGGPASASSTVPLFEGHGTGTAVGDATELRALSAARRDAGADRPGRRSARSRRNIGHTKAAAGVAGLIKATMALRHAIVPPTTGCARPRAELTAADRTLRAAAGGRALAGRCAAARRRHRHGLRRDQHPPGAGGRPVRSAGADPAAAAAAGPAHPGRRAAAARRGRPGGAAGTGGRAAADRWPGCRTAS